MLVAACHSGSGNKVGGVGGGGAPPAAAYGTVAGFGSLLVDGVRFDTSQARFTIDGEVGAQSDLDVGDVVLVTGTLDVGGTTGVATTVSFDDNVEGPVGAIDSAAGTLTVLGQVVQVSADTSFAASIQPASLAGLAAGQTIEVSGLVASDGSIAATHIAPGAMAGELELTGTVSSLMAGTLTFDIGAQAVDYSAAQLDGFPASGLADGQLVEVKASSVASGALAATRIEYRGGALAGVGGARREVEGLIARFASAADFDVAGLRVTTNASTAFVGGTAASLTLDAKVEVEGELNSSGLLVATRVEIRPASVVRLVAVVDGLNASAGTLRALGISIRVDALTRIEDKSSQQVRPFALANLAIGDSVDVRGAEQTAGQVRANLLERGDSRPDSELRGFVQTIGQQTFTILDVQVSATGGTVFSDASGSLSVAQFFMRLAAGDLVEVRGIEIGALALQASEVVLEN
jgi:Domain of unknown function (DUF5666)